ncbi:MAG: M48 family metalloprotease [Desulfobacteraceae bacterium]
MKTNRFTTYMAVILTILLPMVWCTPAAAISLKEEHKLAREFMKYITRNYELIEDPTIVGYVENIGKKILATMPPQPFEYHFYVIKEESYNAFAIPAGHVFVHSGLLAAMDSEDELAGILGHEIAHVANRHISKRIERSKKMDLVTLAGMVAGVFIGATTGNSAAAQTLTLGSAAANQAATLAYSREDEAQADQSGLQYILAAGYDPKGLMTILKKIRSKQWFGSNQIPTYMMTHPAVEDRIIWIDSWSKMNRNNHPPDKLQAAKTTIPFQKINIRLKAMYGDPNVVLQEFQNALQKSPKNGDLLYGYGLTLARMGKRSEAVEMIKKAQSQSALDPFILTDLGRIYFTDGRYQEAYNTLEGALSIPADNPAGLYYLGRTQMELNKLDAAIETFLKLIKKHPDHKPAYFSLGDAYGRNQEMANAHYYLGIHSVRTGDYRNAHFHLAKARRLLKDPAKLEVIDKTLEEIGPLPRNNDTN